MVHLQSGLFASGAVLLPLATDFGWLGRTRAGRGGGAAVAIGNCPHLRAGLGGGSIIDLWLLPLSAPPGGAWRRWCHWRWQQAFGRCHWLWPLLRAGRGGGGAVAIGYAAYPGGAWRRRWRSNVEINLEDLRALRFHGIWSCLPLIYLKYLFKIWGFVFKRK